MPAIRLLETLEGPRQAVRNIPIDAIVTRKARIRGKQALTDSTVPAYRRTESKLLKDTWDQHIFKLQIRILQYHNQTIHPSRQGTERDSNKVSGTFFLKEKTNKQKQLTLCQF